ncbi:LOW QUALITY PROTEIN: NADP-dependent malic enzyme [Perognathus longimembris pacificus]|uniref:LOW QUALITY PROTEIN: NADP-dependent malic enzyme n=1 Tax=Perognathus longimembris pacificus TaxID=214514 RepID=UPI002019F513|nr:LOW QUALITY PROTEIN: NADP-dependent malic enzyme [Perognathus longimembris pacificus]
MEPATPRRRHTRQRGYLLTRDPHLNKDLAFTLEERQQLNIHGLLPPCFASPEIQVLRVVKSFERLGSDFDRYLLLMDLQDRNEKLFYRVLLSDIETFMPIVYTPTVGLACQQYSLAFRKPRGLFISIHDRGHIASVLNAWPEDVIKAVVVTDGERILGLGDLGCNGMGIPVGKLALYTACGGVDPQQCLPVLLDVGTQNEALLNDPLYIGLRQKRVRGADYDSFLDEFMEAVSSRYGMNCLIQFEDFANMNAFRLLNKYRNRYCTFNDDIQGTASVAVAGLLAALRITKNKLADQTILFQGAGEAALGIAHLIVMAMEKEGLPKEKAIRKIWLVDSKGLIVKGRASLTPEKEQFAHTHEEMKSLEAIVQEVKPTALIGVAAIGGAFSEQILKDMAAFNQRPIIFALSNPTSKAECSAEQCYKHTQGRAIFASGSPFDPVTLPSGRTLFPGQGNNAYVFPGVALGVLACGLRHITDKVFLSTAEVISQQVSDEHLEEGRLYPPLSTIRDVSLKIAVKIVKDAYQEEAATVLPEPQDKEAFVRAHMYSTDYDQILPDCYPWPAEARRIQTRAEH